MKQPILNLPLNGSKSADNTPLESSGNSPTSLTGVESYAKNNSGKNIQRLTGTNEDTLLQVLDRPSDNDYLATSGPDAKVVENNCVVLSGSDYCVYNTGSIAAGYFGACTISAWVILDSGESDACLWSHGDASYRAQYASYNGSFFLNGKATTNVPVPIGEWFHVEVEYASDGSAIRLELNDTDQWVGNIAAGSTSSQSRFSIGARLNTIGAPALIMKGSLSDLCVDSQHGLHYTFSGGLGMGTTEPDVSGNGNHGTWTTSNVTALRAGKQDVIAHNLERGCSKVFVGSATIPKPESFNTDIFDLKFTLRATAAGINFQWIDWASSYNSRGIEVFQQSINTLRAIGYYSGGSIGLTLFSSLDFDTEPHYYEIHFESGNNYAKRDGVTVSTSSNANALVGSPSSISLNSGGWQGYLQFGANHYYVSRSYGTTLVGNNNNY